MRVLSKLSESLAVELPLRAIFDAPTVAELAQVVRSSAEGAFGSSAYSIIPAREHATALPLSSVQTGMWLAARMGGDPTAYHITWALRLSGELNRTALRSSLHALVQRHDSLRLCVVEHAGTPMQQLGDKVTLVLQEHDVSSLPAELQREELTRLLNAARHERFDLAQAPLARASLVKLGASEHALQIVLHHLIGDGSSEAILRRDLSELYAAFCTGKPAHAAPGGLGYPDFAAWENERIRTGMLQPQLLYWTERLRDIAPLNLPIDARASQAGAGESAAVRFALPRALALELQALASARAQRCSCCTWRPSSFC